MNIEETKDKMRLLKFPGMLRSYCELTDNRKENDLDIDEAIAFLIDSEWDERYNRKLSRLLASARFRYNAFFKDITFGKERNLEKGKIMRFSTATWINNAESIIITGPTGSGKSYLACALGHQACINSCKVMYFSCLKIFSHLMQAKGDGTYIREINKINNQDLIILDDFGLQKLDSYNRLVLLEILEDRHGCKSTIITSQLPPNKWHEIIGDSTIADAVVDRLIHTSHQLNLKAEQSLRIPKK